MRIMNLKPSLAVRDQAFARCQEIEALAKNKPENFYIMIDDTLLHWNEAGQAYLNGVITDFTTGSAQEMLEDLSDKDEITININSPGGSVYDGVALRNLFAGARQNITMNVIGMAYSAASLMVQGADQRNVAKGAIIGIHKTFARQAGGVEDMEWMAEQLRVSDGSLMEVFAASVPEEKFAKVKELVENDTALLGKDAIDLGLADSVLTAEQEKAAKANYEKQKKKAEKPSNAAPVIPEAAKEAPTAEHRVSAEDLAMSLRIERARAAL